ncbi:putative pyruvate dehydrogenase kinase [Amylocarpus encephaloides]|uniref:Protein-serine/threonine kinase n=1 Tax=Amylocarpus encephaloides TaxID=45428 RepID=A0A9P8C8X2_9HELO|nr:putative pyruvate dehydrogenase kinase [Amylocarpus encephaloides]
MLRTCPQKAQWSLGLTRRAASCVGIRTSVGVPQVRRAHAPPPWRPAYSLDQWVAKEARPISLRQLMVFGRTLTESRLIGSANYVRTELPTRLAHRIRDMQTLPYVVVTNPHISQVYELYYKAFEGLRRLPEVKTLEDNERFCEKVGQSLQEHLTVIPKLAMGVLECRGLMGQADMDRFMNTILRSRISRRVIAEQHIALTETFHNPHHFPESPLREAEFVGEVLVKCNAKDVVTRCGQEVAALAQIAYGPSTLIPSINLSGHLHATFPYILSHIEYIIGELLRNSIQGIVERQKATPGPPTKPPPIEVTVCEAQQHVIIRVSDQGGGIPRDVLPHIWSFSKGPRSDSTLQNLNQVPKMAATLQELRVEGGKTTAPDPKSSTISKMDIATHNFRSSSPKSGVLMHDSSLASLSSRDPNLRLGMGLPLSRVYAEYWAGSLELHSLEGYGVDAFLQISKLGNKNEQLTMRASMDAV